MPTFISVSEPAPLRTAWPISMGVVMVLLAAAATARAQDGPLIANSETSAPAPETALQGAKLLAALKRGGYVLYFRHTATDFSKTDVAMQGYGDCDHQRPLTAQGRRDATQIGEHIRALGLPAGVALASPYCRTMEHARLMLGKATPSPDVREAQGGDFAGLKRLLATPVPAGSNRWIVGHGMPFRTVAGPPQLAEGEAAVIAPGTTRWTVVARLGVDDWKALAGSP